MEKIVVVEDAEDIIHSLYDLFSEAGYTVFTAKNAVEGIHLLKEVMPDLIICDVLMPQKNGFSFYTELKETPAFAEIPLIFLSAMADKQVINSGMNLGALHYVTKPYDAVNLLSIVKDIFDKKNTTHDKKNTGN